MLEALRALEGAELVVEAKKGGFVPAREASRVSIAELRGAGRRSLGFPQQDPDATAEALSRVLATAEQAAEAALEVLRRHGIRHALVAAGGDIVVGDAPPGAYTCC